MEIRPVISTRVAMRTGSSTLNFRLGDHPSLTLGTGLGSTAITTNSSGVYSAEIRYMPWGTTRYTSGTTPTTFQFTSESMKTSSQLRWTGLQAGQRMESGLGLLFYNARWYDPVLGRFVQADTVVPGGVQGLDRYAYTFNNPLKYTDPSGHEICDADGNCNNNESIEASLYRYGIFIEAEMNEGDKLQVLLEASSMGTVLTCVKGDCSSFNTESNFKAVMGTIRIKTDDNVGNYCEVGNSGITCHGGTTGKLGSYGFAGTITHEYGHILDNRLDGAGTSLMENNGIYVSGDWISGPNNDGTPFMRTSNGYACEIAPCMMHSLDWMPEGPTASEEFADMWMNYVLGSFADNNAGLARYSFMEINLPLILYP